MTSGRVYLAIGLFLLLGGGVSGGWLLSTGRHVRSGGWDRYGWEISGGRLHTAKLMVPVSMLKRDRDDRFVWYWTTSHGSVPAYSGIVTDWNFLGLAGRAGIPGITLEYEAVLWPLPAGLLIAGIGCVAMGVRAVRRKRFGACMACGYDLQGVPTIDGAARTCPECGVRHSPRETGNSRTSVNAQQL